MTRLLETAKTFGFLALAVTAAVFLCLVGAVLGENSRASLHKG